MEGLAEMRKEFGQRVDTGTPRRKRSATKKA
jgi:hypothetical protein